MSKYVKLEHVQELLKLFKTRDAFNDWSSEYEKYNKKIKKTIEWLENNAKEMPQRMTLKERIKEAEDKGYTPVLVKDEKFIFFISFADKDRRLNKNEIIKDGNGDEFRVILHIEQDNRVLVERV